MAILRGACFERVSTEEQAKYGYSVRAQIDALNEYCEKNNIKIVDHYTDEGVSAGKPIHKRPEMQRLLEDVKAGKIDIILFTRLDRWYRSTKYYYQAQEILDNHGVSWKAIQEDYETETASGRFKVNIMLAVAEAEREKTAERLSVVFDNKRKRKEAWFGRSSMPFGYTKEPDENGVPRLVKDPATIDAVQEFWDIALKYENVSKAARHVNMKYGLNRTKKLWFDVIRKEIYYGKCRDVENYCEPYVSKEDWEKLQKRQIKKTQQNRVYLFTGLVKCPLCGCTLSSTYTKQTRKGGYIKEYRGYRCRHQAVGTCSNRNTIYETKIENWLLDNLEDLLRNEIASVEIEKAKPKKKSKTNTAALKEKLRRLNVAYMAGNKTDEEYLSESAELKDMIKRVEAEEGEEPAERDLSILQETLETDFRSIYEGLSKEDQRRFWRLLIKEIHIEGKEVKSVDFF